MSSQRIILVSKSMLLRVAIAPYNAGSGRMALANQRLGLSALSYLVTLLLVANNLPQQAALM